MGCTMAKCINCQVEVLDDVDICPLCRSVLLPTEEVENIYPNVRPHLRHLTLNLNIYLFCAILLEAGLLTYDIWRDLKVQWSIATGVALFYIYAIWSQAVNGRTSYKNRVAVMCLLSSFFLIGIDLSMGFKGWSITYVLPFGMLIVDAMILYLMAKNRRNWQSYMMGQIWMMLCSLVVCVTCFRREMDIRIAGISLLISCLIFMGTFIIGGHRARTELKRRFHTH